MPRGKILTPDEKTSMTRQHLLEKIPVSTLCDQHGISPVNFYNWQRQLFENGAVCFERKKNSANERRQDAAAERKIAELQSKLQSKNEVIAELLEEHVQLKKANGEL